MKAISIINLKGGVAKTISAVNIAYILAAVHGHRVLVVDNDKQGNTSKFFGVHGYDAPSIAEVLTEKGFDPKRAIVPAWSPFYSGPEPPKVPYNTLDVMPANMNLLAANKAVLLDCSRPQQTRLAKALDAVAADYDYCIIDNAPDLNMSVINALVATDDVLIPIKVDSFAFEGLEILTEQIEEVREFNPRIGIAGCFITMAQRNNVTAQGKEYLAGVEGLPLLKTAIRKTCKVDESTFANKPLLAYAKKSTATHDYTALVEEYLKG